MSAGGRLRVDFQEPSRRCSASLRDARRIEPNQQVFKRNHIFIGIRLALGHESAPPTLESCENIKLAQKANSVERIRSVGVLLC